jgi:hypothetical protein
MSDHPVRQLTAKQTLLLILLPLLITWAGIRLYLHLVRVQHIYPGGYLIHHLFTGVLLLIPAAFLLAFGTRRQWLAISTRVAVGIGSALVLDEITYLVMTKATDQDYVSKISLFGAIVFISVAVTLLWIFYRSRCE